MSQDSPNQGPQLREHVYDGIQEYDQKLPNWWLFTWYITMVWFVIAWVAYYQFGVGMSDEKNIQRAMDNIAEVQKQELEQINDDKLWEMSRDEKIVAAGAATYNTTCVACHAADLSAHLAGAKLPGLPLNDQEWKHGGNPTQILTVVRKGSPDITKGMPPWEPQLGLQRVVEVVAYVLSKHEKGEPITLAGDSPLKAK
ncbi:cytochrome c oxidase cbb3-type subunit 3 [Prosthecobacter debontii]|uniref:Cytochrome c oxidase cbb3-type subunit 3 n=1 Tax=Prosthecobacter debontii TaxID=48467 RepID=A0A1T4WJF5_9BACT|nr:cbb3-type cytochrome c oxidase N-terminal domain-containing protein [Prosthecobacter debontii]SKA77486.1 cytochrome c oxidase cbb3-type subunit 3 [Prosthecobacter debontii]